MADQNVVDEFALAAIDTCEPLVLRDQQFQVPHSISITLVSPIEAGRAELRATRAEQNLRRGGLRFVIEIACDDDSVLASVTTEQFNRSGADCGCLCCSSVESIDGVPCTFAFIPGRESTAGVRQQFGFEVD